MRCRVCGLELDERDRLRNGAYQCPECGAIHHTASSSKLSPSPWRRKRKRGFPALLDALNQRRGGLPLWGWLAIALAAVIVLIVLLVSGGKDAPADASATPTQEVPAVETTVEPGVESEPVEGADGAQLESPDGAASADVPATNTGVAQNDFVVSFEWAMSYLGYNASLTPSGEAAGNVQNYTFQDWMDLTLTLGADGSTICSASANAQLAEGATDNTPVLAAFVSVIYGFDNKINAGTVRNDIEAMIADPTRTYDSSAFSAVLTSGSFSGYSLDVTGKLS